MWLCHALVKRIVEVKFVGQMPFVTPVVVYEDGEERMLGLLPVGEREKALPIQGMLQSSKSSPLPARLQLPKFPQLNDFLGQFSRNLNDVLQNIFPVIPKREPMYYRQESQKEFIRRMQKDGQLFPTCPDSSFTATKCNICDRNEICSSLREQERKRIKIMKEMYEGDRYG